MEGQARNVDLCLVREQEPNTEDRRASINQGEPEELVSWRLVAEQA